MTEVSGKIVARLTAREARLLQATAFNVTAAWPFGPLCTIIQLSSSTIADAIALACAGATLTAVLYRGEDLITSIEFSDAEELYAYVGDCARLGCIMLPAGEVAA